MGSISSSSSEQLSVTLILKFLRNLNSANVCTDISTIVYFIWVLKYENLIITSGEIS